MATCLFEVHYSEPETYQWRIELDCGCVRDAVTRHHTDDKPADRSSGYASWPRRTTSVTSSYFGHIKPSEREIREANEQAGKHAEQAARANVAGTVPPEEPERPSIYGKAQLPAGHLLCYDPNCTNACLAGTVRIRSWDKQSSTFAGAR